MQIRGLRRAIVIMAFAAVLERETCVSSLQTPWSRRLARPAART